MATAPMTSVTKLIAWQLLVLVVVVGFFGLVGKPAQISAILGGLLAAIPILLFTRQAFRFSGAKQARQVLYSFYLGEALKLISCTVGFILVFKYADNIQMSALWLSFGVQLPIPIVLAITGKIKPNLLVSTSK